MAAINIIPAAMKNIWPVVYLYSIVGLGLLFLPVFVFIGQRIIAVFL